MQSNQFRRRGAAMVYLCIVLVAMMAMATLVVDLGRAEIAKTQLRAVADGAALYGSMGVTTGYGPAWAQLAATRNTVDGNSVTLQAGDILTGNWANGTFTNGGTPTNAIQVTAYYTAARGGGVLPYFGSIIGAGKMNMTATATAVAGTSSQYGIIGINSIQLSGSGSASFNSSVSTTGWTTPNSNGNMESNGNIQMSGSSAVGKGNVMAGIGKQVQLSGGATVTGTTGNLTTALSFPNASAGTAATVNNNSNIPAAYLNNGQFNISGSNSVSLPGGVYYFTQFQTSGSSSVTFTGPTVIYCTGNFQLSGGSFSTSGNVATNLQVNICGNGNVQLSGSSTLYAQIYAPQSDCQVSGSGILAGTVTALTLEESGSAKIITDEALVSNGGNSTLVQ